MKEKKNYDAAQPERITTERTLYFLPYFKNYGISICISISQSIKFQ